MCKRVQEMCINVNMTKKTSCTLFALMGDVGYWIVAKRFSTIDIGQRWKWVRVFMSQQACVSLTFCDIFWLGFKPFFNHTYSQEELDEINAVWNSHRIRPTRNHNVPVGFLKWCTLHHSCGVLTTSSFHTMTLMTADRHASFFELQRRYIWPK